MVLIYTMDVFTSLLTIFTCRFGKEGVRGTGSRHPSFGDKFYHEKSDLDILVFTTESLDTIKKWVEKKSHEGSSFIMKNTQILWKGRCVIDIIIIKNKKEFPTSYITCENELPWVTTRTLLANYRYQYEPDAPGFDSSKKHAAKIKHIEKLIDICDFKDNGDDGKSPQSKTSCRRKFPKSPHSERKRKLNFCDGLSDDESPQSRDNCRRKLQNSGDETLQSDDTQLVKTLFF